MKQDFFSLPKDSQAALIKSAETSLGLMDTVIEKDIWICKLLEILFSMLYNMVFKGGTSLSKVYNLISRFSEDVDITIDYKHFRDPIDLNKISRSQLKKISNELKISLSEFVRTEIISYIKSYMKNNVPNIELKMNLSDNGEQLRIYYPSVLDSNINYLRDHVLLEFGIRNEIEPQEEHMIKPHISELYDDKIAFATPTVNTLSPIRTFWEKSTLIHVECNRDKIQHSPDRLSRHWYDIYLLNNSWVGKEALKSKDILEKVIIHKKAFFNSSYANYEDCLNGKFRIIPHSDSLLSLENDYKRMVNSGMFMEVAPEFSKIISSLREYETNLNKN